MKEAQFMLVYESNNDAFAFSEGFVSHIVLPSDYLIPVAVPEVYNQLQDAFNKAPAPLLTYPKGSFMANALMASCIPKGISKNSLFLSINVHRIPDNLESALEST